MKMAKCGSFFNRHNWEEVYEEEKPDHFNLYRHCTKCGLWQRLHGASSDDPWWELSRPPQEEYRTTHEKIMGRYRSTT